MKRSKTGISKSTKPKAKPGTKSKDKIKDKPKSKGKAKSKSKSKGKAKKKARNPGILTTSNGISIPSRPANPCKVFEADPDENLVSQIENALWASRPLKYKAIWLPDLQNFDIGDIIVQELPVLYTRWNRGGTLGIWLEMIDDPRHLGTNGGN